MGLARFVDIDRGALFELSVADWGLSEVLRCDTTLGAAVHAASGGFLLAAGGGLRHVDARGDTIREFPLVAPGVASRLNDGATDPGGRYIVGSMATDERRGQERLWRLENDGTTTVLDDDLTLSNGLGWSPDGATFYNVDSKPGTVWSRPYDVDRGATGPRHRLLDVTDATPDGLSVDAEGNLWIAIWGGHEVRGYTPAGELFERIAVGAPLVTSCAFVGADLATLLVTTAGKQEPGVTQTPLGGALFAVDMPTRGLPTTPWRPVSF